MQPWFPSTGIWSNISDLHVWKNTANEGAYLMKEKTGNVQQSLKKLNLWGPLRCVCLSVSLQLIHRQGNQSWLPLKASLFSVRSVTRGWLMLLSWKFVYLFICVSQNLQLAASSRVGRSRWFQRNPTFSAGLTGLCLFFYSFESGGSHGKNASFSQISENV